MKPDILVISDDHPYPPYTGRSPKIRAAYDKMMQDRIGSKSVAQNPTQPQAEQGFEASDVSSCPVVDQSPLPTALSIPHTPTPRPTRTKALQAAVEDVVGLLDSDELLSHVKRLVFAFETVQKLGGMAFTLNLNSKRERSLLEGSDQIDKLRRYIGRELRRSFGRLIPFAFIFEVCPKGRLHVHGAILSKPDALEDKERIRDALARAGGKIKGRAGARQVSFKPQSDGIGWYAYSSKELDTVCGILGTHKITFVSDALTNIMESPSRPHSG